MNVSVFGSSAPRPGEPVYQMAQELGATLAHAGHTVLTGGYMGTMEAVSRGAGEAGGHVIGVTCNEIERWRGAKANPWVREEWKVETLSERLGLLIDRCEAAIALPGGPGTLAEVSLMWNRMIVASIPPRPLILIGAGWRGVFDNFAINMGAYTGEPTRRLLSFADNAATAAAMLETRPAAPK